ncbi:hypothetical protein ACQYAD_08045 [Neobacillus sp. SM06]|uniref:hypothetical protein n=1 Tax=Neobacillus sp. SM06 TaxID=3422492 RepID=UPI003D2BF756
MKKIWPMLLLTMFIFIGILLLAFVIRMINFHEEKMGMTLGKEMMLHHLTAWGQFMFWILLVAAGVCLLVSLFFRKK